MCQLLGMNCNVPTDICFSFRGFSARGGKTDLHQDGWGIAFFEGSGCRIFLDNKPAVDSPVADLVLKYPIHSTHVIAHIRKASFGPVAIENCHPFQRELWGKYWVLAHNGDLPDLKIDTKFYRPVGETDSEKAFCLILETLRKKFPDEKPTLEKIYLVLREVTQKISEKGTFNYLLSDGDFFFAHCSTQLFYLVRQAPFAAAHLIDEDMSVDFKELTRAQDRVAIIATAPLTDNEKWTSILPGQLLAFTDGMPVNFA
jgi:predicted glutamine amidotransferase